MKYMTVDAHVNSKALETHQLTFIYSFRKIMKKGKPSENCVPVSVQVNTLKTQHRGEKRKKL